MYCVGFPFPPPFPSDALVNNILRKLGWKGFLIIHNESYLCNTKPKQARFSLKRSKVIVQHDTDFRSYDYLKVGCNFY